MNDNYHYFHLGCGGQLVDTGKAVDKEPQFRCTKCAREGCPDLIWDEDTQDPRSTEFELNGQSIRVVLLVLPKTDAERAHRPGDRDLLMRTMV